MDPNNNYDHALSSKRRKLDPSALSESRKSRCEAADKMPEEPCECNFCHESAAVAKRNLPAALECAYQFLKGVLPYGGGCNIIDWVVDYARSDFKGNRCLTLRGGHNGSIGSLAALPGSRLASAAWRGSSIRVWNIATGACIFTLTGHLERVNSLAVLRDGKLASGSSDTTVRMWNTETGKCMQILKGHHAHVTSLAALSGGILASGCSDGTIHVWETATGVRLQTLQDHVDSCQVMALSVLSDGTLMSATSLGLLHKWDLATSTCTHMRIPCFDLSRVTAMASLSHGNVALGCLDGIVQIWNTTTDNCERTMRGHTGAVHALAVLEDGTLASLGDDETVLPWQGNDDTMHVWNTSTGICTHTLQVHIRSRSLAALPNGKIASGAYQGEIHIWE